MADIAAAVLWPLRQSQEVINEYVNVGQEIRFGAPQGVIAVQFCVFLC